jgi:hypothetical protein
MMHSNRAVSFIHGARMSLGVALAAAWLGACDADDTGLFSDDAPLSPAGGTGGSSMADAGGGGVGGSRPLSMPPSTDNGGGGSGSDVSDDDGGGLAAAGSGARAGGEDLPDEPPTSAEPVALQFNQCDAFTPCGGALAGSWVYTAGCLELADLGLVLSDNGCQAVNASLTGKLGGTLRFNGGRVEHDSSASGAGTLRIPALCTLAIAGCPGFRELINDDEDACTQTAGECVCEFSTEETEWTEDSFQASGSTFTLGGGRTFDYCVQGDSLTYRETSDDGTPQDASLHVLTRR